MRKFLTITDDELAQLDLLLDDLRWWQSVGITRLNASDVSKRRQTLAEIIRHVNYRAKTPDITPEEWDYINNNQDQRYICPEVLRDAVETGNTHFWVDFLLGGKTRP